MNVQIFGTKKCNDTKKAERFFKERGIKFQFIDMKEKGMSKGEFNSVAQANGGLENIRQILVDKETGVNYLCWTSGNGAGITSLLDSEEFDKSFTYKEKLKLPGQLF